MLPDWHRTSQKEWSDLRAREEADHRETERQLRMQVESARWRAQLEESIIREQVERAQWHTQVEKSINCERREADHPEHERQLKMQLERAQWREQQDRSQPNRRFWVPEPLTSEQQECNLRSINEVRRMQRERIRRLQAELPRRGVDCADLGAARDSSPR